MEFVFASHGLNQYFIVCTNRKLALMDLMVVFTTRATLNSLDTLSDVSAMMLENMLFVMVEHFGLLICRCFSAVNASRL